MSVQEVRAAIRFIPLNHFGIPSNSLLVGAIDEHLTVKSLPFTTSATDTPWLQYHVQYHVQNAL